MKKALLIVLIVILAAVLAAGGYIFWQLNKMNNNNNIEIVAAPTEEPTPTPLAAEQFVFTTIDPATITPTPTPEPTPMPAPIFKVDSIDKDIVNVLLVGIDPREEDASSDSTGNSDSMMLVSCNLKTHRVCIFSFMRDGAVYLNNSSDWYDKINKAYSNGGIGMLINTMNGSRNFQLDVQNYVSITFKMFEHIIDAFGGIDVELTEEECQFINKKCMNEAAKVKQLEYTQIEVYAGMHHLTGETALWYCRDRYSGGTADYGRTARQRHVIQLMYEKIRKEWTLSRLMDIINYVSENSATNLSADAIVQLASIAISNDFVVETTTIPFPGTGSNSTNKKGKYLLRYDMKSTRETLLNVIYNGEPMPDGVETNFGGSDED